MLKLTKIILILLLVIFLVSCGTTYKFGKKFDKTNIEQIIIGITTQQEVINMFGEPWRQGSINGNKVYTYSYEEVIFKEDDSVEKNGDTLVIEFDDNNIVKNYYLNIPGKEPIILGFMMHKRNKEKEQQAAQQNQMAAQPQFTPPNISF